jgi:signal transduction histidine kinase
MQAAGQIAQSNRKDGKKTGAQRKRVETVVETLATLRSQGETLSAVAHDARNMVTALGLYCDLLDEPGVLAAPFVHYGRELRLIASASRRLVEKLVMLDAQSVVAGPMAAAQPGAAAPKPATGPNGMVPSLLTTPETGSNHGSSLNSGRHAAAHFGARLDLLPSVSVDDLAEELLANRSLLSALAGPSIVLTVDVNGGARRARITGEDLTRVLVNLVKNAFEAMPSGGRIHLTLSERAAPNEAAKESAANSANGQTRHTASSAIPVMVLTVEDDGPGIPAEALDEIFVSGYTTRAGEGEDNGGWPSFHRGLGLAISRSIIEAAGGRISARNRETGGASIEMELPVLQERTGNRLERTDQRQ